MTFKDDREDIMANIDIEDLFALHDDQENFEVPRGWENYDYDNAYKSALALKHSIETLINDSCYMDIRYSVKKATFIADIKLPESSVVEKKEEALIRISHFGRMVTIVGKKKHDSLNISGEYRNEITQLIEEHGYILIPNEYLWMKFANKRKFKNWGHRYFDFVK